MKTAVCVDNVPQAQISSNASCEIVSKPWPPLRKSLKRGLKMASDARRLFLLPRDSWWPPSETGCERRVLSLPDPRHGRARKYMLEIESTATAPRLLEVQQVAHPSPSSWFVDQAVLSGKLHSPLLFLLPTTMADVAQVLHIHAEGNPSVVVCRWLRARCHTRRRPLLASSTYGAAQCT